MAQNLPRALQEDYTNILRFLKDVVTKDIPVGAAESTFLLKNEAYVPLIAKFVETKSDMGLLGKDPTPSCLQGFDQLPELDEHGLMDSSPVDWLTGPFSLPLNVLAPVRDHYEHMIAARPFRDAPNLVHAQAPPYHFIYSRVFNVRALRHGKQGGKKRDTPGQDSPPTKKQQVGDPSKGSGDYPSIEESRSMGKKGKGRLSIPRANSSQGTNRDYKPGPAKSWQPKSGPRGNN